MTKTKKPKKPKKLRVEADGRRRFINVPEGRSTALHNYLRTNQVRSLPPAPAYVGFDNIELAQDINVERVQTLLNAWQ